MAGVTFADVSKIYPDGTRAVNAIDLEIQDGEFMVLVGPSGCGKTTALRMVAGLEDISEGVLKIGDRVVNNVPSRDRDIAMVFQSYALYPHLTVYDNIAFGLKLKKMPKAEIDKRVQEAAKVLGLESFLKRKPRALSGGQRQRVAMGRAIVREPAAFLMDEPLSNLDAKLRVQMRAEIAKLQSDLGTTTVYVTHDQVEAMTMGDRVAVMRKGELQQVAAPQELYDRPLNLFVAGFIGSPSMNLVEATLEGGNGSMTVVAGNQKIALGEETLSSRPALKSFTGRDGHPRHSAGRPRGCGTRRGLLVGPDAHRRRAADRGARLGGDGALHHRRAARGHGRGARAAEGRRHRGNGVPGSGGRYRHNDGRPLRRALEGSQGRARQGVGRHSRTALLRPGDGTRHLRRNERTRMKRQRLTLLGLMLALLLLVGACGSDDEEGGGAGTTGGETTGESVSGSISVIGVWTGPEQKSFQAVIDGFTEQNPDATVKYTSGGDNIVTVLSTAVEGGNPPDIATVSQPGTMADFVSRDALQPLDFATDAVTENFGQSIVDIGTVDGTLYGLLFKAANKSTVWYNVAAYEDAGVEAPETWDAFLEDAKTINASGLPAYSIGGADGWTLTDLFENIYIQTAGPETYDKLAAHEIPWTDQSVKDALTEMAKIVGDTDNIAGGQAGALQTDFPTSVANVFSATPKAAEVLEGDFVPGVAGEKNPLEPETGFNVFPFPKIGDAGLSVVGGGDMVVMFKANPTAQAFVEYLTTPEASEIWAKRGGFSSPNKNVDKAVYPDEIQRTTAGAIGEAEVFRFDLSDLQPSAFGGTVGQGLFKLFQDFLKNPDDIDGITTQMEAAAAKAFG